MVFAEEYQYDYNPFLGYLFIAYADVYFVSMQLMPRCKTRSFQSCSTLAE